MLKFIQTAGHLLFFVNCIFTASLISNSVAQYSDFYSSMRNSFVQGSMVNPSRTLARGTEAPSSIRSPPGRYHSGDQPPAPTTDSSQRRSVAPLVGSDKFGMTHTMNTRILSSKIETSTGPSSVANVNAWESIPNLFFKSSPSPATPPPKSNLPAKEASLWQGISFPSSESFTSWDYSPTNLNDPDVDPSFSGATQSVSQDVFLPLADHSPGSSLVDFSGPFSDWSALPIRSDTYTYPAEPTPPPKIILDGKSMARAILNGEVNRWKWNYSSTSLGTGASTGDGNNYQRTKSCCRRLPYICAVDGTCILDVSVCTEYCTCALNPSSPHCLTVIPRIKTTMRRLEDKALAELAKELNVTTPPPAYTIGVTTPTTVRTTTTTIATTPSELIETTAMTTTSSSLTTGRTDATATENDKRARHSRVFPVTASYLHIPTRPTPSPQANKATNAPIGSPLSNVKESNTIASTTLIPTTTSTFSTPAPTTMLPRQSTQVHEPTTTSSPMLTPGPAITTSTRTATRSTTSASTKPPSTAIPTTTPPRATGTVTTVTTPADTTSATTKTTPMSLTDNLLEETTSTTKKISPNNALSATTPHNMHMSATDELIRTTLSSTTAPPSSQSPTTTSISPSTENPKTAHHPSTVTQSSQMLTRGVTETLFTEHMDTDFVHKEFSEDSTEHMDTDFVHKEFSEDNTGFVDMFSNQELQNVSDFVSPELEQDFLSWFRQGSPGTQDDVQSIALTTLQTTDATTSTSLPSSAVHEPCRDDCEDKGGSCVMGNDFRPHCVTVTENACDHFRCDNGICVSTDGMYACECDDGWMGTFCDQPCTVDCGPNGYCGRIDEAETVGCICYWNYTGLACEQKREIIPRTREVAVPNEGLKAWEVAVVAVVTAIFLALICVLLPYILWRRQWLPMRKLVFYFQEYEDDDDKEFDAFISYKSTPRDERFILHHLYPKLEKELDFRLCLHFRDFPPGEPIANNIIHAIENSRRTIMVLSPSYVASEWCRMEYQKAQYEMLKLKHKIIPIVLEDVSHMPEMDKNLKAIIDTVTYIQWPGEEETCGSKRLAKFWRLLELSMPKKKSEYSRSVSSGSFGSDVPLAAVSKTCMNSIVASLTDEDVQTSCRSTLGSQNSPNYSERTECVSTTTTLSTFQLSDGGQIPVKVPEHAIPITQPLSIHAPNRGQLNTRRNGHNYVNAGSLLNSSDVSHVGGTSHSLIGCHSNCVPAIHEAGRLRDEKQTTSESSPPVLKQDGFLTSDDHIIEFIREVGSRAANHVIITPRPRIISPRYFP